jgi:hypothetical protein
VTERECAKRMELRTKRDTKTKEISLLLIKKLVAPFLL